MSTNHTPNYNLSQWETTDPVLCADFNQDNAKIDAVLKAEADARTAAVASLSSSRNCQAMTVSYIGNGVSGESHPLFLSHLNCILDFAADLGNLIRASLYGSGNLDRVAPHASSIARGNRRVTPLVPRQKVEQPWRKPRKVLLSV